MYTALVISITAAVAFLILWLDSLGDRAEYRRLVAEKESLLEAVRKRRREQLEEGARDERDRRTMTAGLMDEVLSENGFTPIHEDGYVSFVHEGETYHILTNRLPLFFLDKLYVLERNKYDMAVFREAAAKTTQDMVMVNVSLDDGGSTLRFRIDAYEPVYGHCRDSLMEYLKVIESAQRNLSENYDTLLEKARGIRQLEDYGIRRAVTGRGHNMTS